MLEFQALAEACANWTLTDRRAGIKAVWDDESYLQRCVLRGTLIRPLLGSQTIGHHILCPCDVVTPDIHPSRVADDLLVCSMLCCVSRSDMPVIMHTNHALLSVCNAGISRSTCRR